MQCYMEFFQSRDTAKLLFVTPSGVYLYTDLQTPVNSNINPQWAGSMELKESQYSQVYTRDSHMHTGHFTCAKDDSHLPEFLYIYI